MRCGHVRNLKRYYEIFFLHVFIHLYENLHQRKFPTIRYFLCGWSFAGEVEIHLSLLTIFKVATFQPPRFEWLLYSLRNISCDAWQLLLICWLICWYGFKEGGRSSCDLASKYHIHISSTRTQTWRELSPSCVPSLSTIQLQTGCLCFISLSLPPSLLPPLPPFLTLPPTLPLLPPRSLPPYPSFLHPLPLLQGFIWETWWQGPLLPPGTSQPTGYLSMGMMSSWHVHVHHYS